MKITNKIYTSCLAILLLACMGCEDYLDVAPPSRLSEDFINSERGINSLMVSAYNSFQFGMDAGTNRMYMEEAGTDIFRNERGALWRSSVPFQEFTFDAAHSWIFDLFWQKPYEAISDANFILSLLEESQIDQATKDLLAAEARFIRAVMYGFMHNWYGGGPQGSVPLKTSAADATDAARASNADMISFITSELTTAASELPVVADTYGKATRGAALGYLTKFYLQVEDWDMAASTAQQVIDLGAYSLFDDYTSMFSVNTEGNSEMVFAQPAFPQNGEGNPWLANAYPPNFPTDKRNTGTQVGVPLDFYNSFDPNDIRRELILGSYERQSNGTILDFTIPVENVADDDPNADVRNAWFPRSFKYPEDPNADIRAHGNDFPIVRYSDILLSRAEGLVMDGAAVTQEAVDLMNQVRTRAGVSAYTLADFADVDAFIDALLQERAWEFWAEGKRREDLLRHDRFIDQAVARGKAAQAHHVRLPIPQTELNNNSLIVQNDGY